MSYCITIHSTQQCSDCTLKNGELFASNGYKFPNCEGTQWVKIQSWSGTNGTSVYRVETLENLPIDDYTPLFAVLMAIVTLKIKFRLWN